MNAGEKMEYNIWNNPSDEMLKTIKEIQIRTGVDKDIIFKVLREHHQIYM